MIALGRSEPCSRECESCGTAEVYQPHLIVRIVASPFRASRGHTRDEVTVALCDSCAESLRQALSTHWSRGGTT